MRIMFGTWAELRAVDGLRRDLHDARDNILAGAAHQRAMSIASAIRVVRRLQRRTRVLCGPPRERPTVSPETRIYLKIVTDRADRRADPRRAGQFNAYLLCSAEPTFTRSQFARIHLRHLAVRPLDSQ